jgi:hypothetical protein
MTGPGPDRSAPSAPRRPSRRAYLLEQRERHGRRAVAALPVEHPREFATALGRLTVELWGPPGVALAAMQGTACGGDDGATADADADDAAGDRGEGPGDVDTASDDGGADPSGSPDDGGDGPLPWIDTHAHPTGIDTDCLDATCVDAAVAAMESFGVRKSIWMSPPSLNTTGDETEILAAVRMRSDRLLWGAGGTRLNSLIQQTPDSGEVTEEQQRAFRERVQSLLEGGEAVAVGEIAALHLSYSESHPYEETPASTPLFLLLADEAAARDLAIDLHMDAVSEDEATPGFFTAASSRNPAELTANVAALEVLLAHNRDARIVWAHVGRDTTGQMTPDLVRSLVEAHSNLYCQIAPAYGPLRSATAIVDETGTIRPAWLGLLQDHPDRFVLGTDTFYAGTSDDGRLLRQVQDFLAQLPADLALRIGCTNAVAVYGLSGGC